MKLFAGDWVSLLRSHAEREVSGEAQDGREAVYKAKTLRPDIVIFQCPISALND